MLWDNNQDFCTSDYSFWIQLFEREWQFHIPMEQSAATLTTANFGLPPQNSAGFIHLLWENNKTLRICVKREFSEKTYSICISLVTKLSAGKLFSVPDYKGYLSFSSKICLRPAQIFCPSTYTLKKKKKTLYLYICLSIYLKIESSQYRGNSKNTLHWGRMTMAFTSALHNWLFLHCMFSLFSPFLHYGWERCCWISLFLFTGTSTNDEQQKFVFPGKKSPCSSARIEVAGADRVITGPHIRLIEDHGSGLTLQQFYYWNCRAECSTAEWDHLSLTFCLCIHSEVAEHRQEQEKLQMDVPEFHHSQEVVLM